LSKPISTRHTDVSDRLSPKINQILSVNRLRKPGFLIVNIAVLLAIVFLVANNSKSNSVSASSINAGTVASVNPLDQVSASDIALTVAQVSGLPETTAVANQAQSAAADLAMTATANNVVTKPEVVTTALKSKADIFSYVAASGDTVASLATKFGVSANSIMWSNGLSSNALSSGAKLVIPPVNGIVYTVKAGDTPATLASTYKANESQIVAYNDAEIGGLTAGERIIIPNATEPASPASSSSSTSPDISAGSGSAAATTFPWGSGPVYGSNGYDYGYCTWYVATQVKVPNNWGNAATWAYYAALSGWNVSVVPTVGAIAQTADAAGGEGHVAMVDAVSPDGSEIQIRDMNGIAGWGKVGYSSWISATTFQHFITP
jgi:surface antigen